MKIGLALALSSLLQSDLYAQAKEYTPLHATAADTISKASIITQVLPDRSVVFRLKAPDARQVSVLVGFSDPPTAMAPSYSLRKDNNGIWSVTVGPADAGANHCQYPVSLCHNGQQGSGNRPTHQGVHCTLGSIENSVFV
jgi:1,4-alpha-glucan branching enzyme